MVFQQQIISHAKMTGGKHLLAVLVVLERAGLSDQGIDHVAIIDRGVPAAEEARHPLNENALMTDLQKLRADFHIDVAIDQPAGHRIHVLPHADRAALAHANPAEHLIRLQPTGGQTAELFLFLGKAVLAMAVRPDDQVFHKRQVIFATEKIPAASQQEGLIDPPLQMPVGRFHIAVLVGRADVDSLGLEAVVIHQGSIALGVDLAIGQVVDCRTQAVRAMPPGHAAELPEGLLNPGRKRLERFRETERDRLDVRVGQHAVKQHVIKPQPGDRHPEIVHHGEIAGRQPARMMNLLEHHWLSRTRRAAPVGDSPLERPPRRVRKSAGIPRLQPLEQRLGHQSRLRFQPGLDFAPNLLERVLPRAVIPRLFPSRRQPPIIAVIPRCLFVHARHPCRNGERLAFAQPPPKFQNLSIRNLHENRKLRSSTKSRSPGILIVAGTGILIVAAGTD